MQNSIFNSFWMGGFECADHLNAFGNRVNMIEMTGHDLHLEADYLRLKEIGISTVREGIIWSEVEKKPYEYDWKWVDRIIGIAQKNNIQVIWDFCHFGFPDDLTPLHPMFARRFSSLCEAFIVHYRAKVPTGKIIVTPINEVSFLSWLGGEVRGTVPYCVQQGWEVKYHLMKAYIEGISKMKMIDTEVVIMSTEPLVNIKPESFENDIEINVAEQKTEEQFQILEILTGNICPELGGNPDYLDLIGLNFYFNNQWVHNSHEIIPWGDTPPHILWTPLHVLAEKVYQRYNRPIVISETSHPGEHRGNWLQYIKDECEQIFIKDIPLLGCCIYPVIDRPDWDFNEHWHRSGLWDIFDLESLERIPFQEAIDVVNADEFIKILF